MTIDWLRLTAIIKDIQGINSNLRYEKWSFVDRHYSAIFETTTLYDWNYLTTFDPSKKQNQ